MTDAQSGHSGFYVSSIIRCPNWNIYNNIYTFIDGSSRPQCQGVIPYDVKRNVIQLHGGQRFLPLNMASF